MFFQSGPPPSSAQSAAAANNGNPVINPAASSVSGNPNFHGAGSPAATLNNNNGKAGSNPVPPFSFQSENPPQEGYVSNNVFTVRALNYHYHFFADL